MVAFGINQTEASLGASWMTPAVVTQVMQGIAAAGGTWVRLWAAWSAMEQARGVDTWIGMDTAVTAARAAGLQPLIVLNEPIPSYGASPTDFGNWAGRVAARYGPKGVGALGNACQTYEIWNEWNNVSFMSPNTGVNFVTYLKAAYPTIHAACPGATVIIGGLQMCGDGFFTISPLTALKQVYAAGGRGYFDAVGNHPYSYDTGFNYLFPPNASNVNFTMDDSLRAFMDSQGDTTVPIWWTEWGIPTKLVTQAQQAAYIQIQWNIYLQRLANYPGRYGPCFLYAFKDLGTDLTNIEDTWGIVDASFTKKQAWATVNNFNVNLLKAGFGAAAGLSVSAVPGDRASFSAAAALSVAASPVIPVTANFTATAALQTPIAGRPPAPFAAAAALSATPLESHTVAAAFTTNALLASQIQIGSYVFPNFATTAALGVVCQQIRQYSYVFTGTGSTKPTSLFTDFAIGFSTPGYFVASDVAQNPTVSTDGNYYGGGIYKQSQLSPNHFSEVDLANQAIISSNRSNMAMVRCDATGQNWIGATARGFGGSDSSQILMCLNGVVSEVANGTGLQNANGSKLRLTADGTVYTATVDGTVVTQWVDSTGAFGANAANMHTGFGLQFMTQFSQTYPAPGINGTWLGYDIRPTISPVSLAPGFLSSAALSALASQSYGLTPALSATAALSAAAKESHNASPAFVGTAALAVAPLESHTVTPAFGASAAAAASATQSFTASATFTVAGALAAIPNESHSLSPQFAASSALAASPLESHAVAVPFATAAALTAPDSEILTQTATFTTTAGLLVGVGAQANDYANFTAGAALGAGAVESHSLIPAFAAAVALAASSRQSYAQGAPLAATASLSAIPVQSYALPGSFPVTAALAANAIESHGISAVFAAAAALAATALEQHSTGLMLSTTAGLAMTATESHSAAAALLTSAALSATAKESHGTGAAFATAAALSCAASRPAPSFDAASSNSGTVNFSTSISVTNTHVGVGSNLTIVALVVCRNGSQAPSSQTTRTCTYGGAAMTSLGMISGGLGTDGYAEVFYITGQASGSKSLVATVGNASNTGRSMSVVAVSYTGVNTVQTSALVTANGSSTTASGTITTSTSTERVVALLGNSTGGAFSGSPTGATYRTKALASDNYSAAEAADVLGGSASLTVSDTLNTAAWAVALLRLSS